MGLLQNGEIGKNFNFFDSKLVSNNMCHLQKLKYFAISQQSHHPSYRWQHTLLFRFYQSLVSKLRDFILENAASSPP
jgi:hypothetical protein